MSLVNMYSHACVHNISTISHIEFHLTMARVLASKWFQVPTDELLINMESKQDTSTCVNEGHIAMTMRHLQE